MSAGTPAGQAPAEHPELAEHEVVVAGIETVADGVRALELRAADGAPLPAWRPGAHIDLLLPNGVERQYSLCGPAEAEGWRVAVLREHPGRGGSAYVHDELAVGARLRARGPRNHFAFEPGTPALFIAGGIGITPVRAMIEAAEASGTPWRLVYAGRRRSGMAFVEELAAAHPERVELHVADEGHRLDVDALLADPQAGTAVYCCGPARLMDAVEAAMAGAGWPHGALHLERFEPKHPAEDAVDAAFEVELELSGQTLTVPADRSILETVEDAGVLVLSSCREGTCGTCETHILAGLAEHRDSVLTPDEQAENRTMMICVSRARSAKLVLEL